MRRLAVVLILAACTKRGEHASTAHLCMDPPDAAPELVDETDRLLRVRLADAGLTPCTPPRPRAYQRGAKPVAFFCGRLGQARVEASINRPGQQDCSIELDLRADVAGSERELTDLEAPIERFRDQVCAWFKQRAATVQRPRTAHDRGVSIRIGGNGAVLGTPGPDPCTDRATAR
jgi:hypothetical protein